MAFMDWISFQDLLPPNGTRILVRQEIPECQGPNCSLVNEGIFQDGFVNLGVGTVYYTTFASWRPFTQTQAMEQGA